MRRPSGIFGKSDIIRPYSRLRIMSRINFTAVLAIGSLVAAVFFWTKSSKLQDLNSHLAIKSKYLSEEV